MSIKAFVFDLDGVIANTTQLHYQAWVHELRKHGIDYTLVENDALKGLPRMNTLTKILERKNLISHFSQRQLQTISLQKNKYYQMLLNSTITTKDLLPGILEFLQKAKKHGIKLAIASSSHNAPTILKKLKIFTMFDYIVNPHHIKNGKPAPDIFLQACRGMNVDSTEAIGFEDATMGIKGLVAANIKAVAITWGIKENWQGAKMQLDTTQELDFDQIMNL